jgi:hypothetical protein
MTGKLDRYGDILQRLADETVACSPTRWERGELAIASDGKRLSYRLHNEGHPDRATLSETLRALIDQLYVKMRRDGDRWDAARLRWWIEGGAIRFETRFDYPQTPPPKRRWWHGGR